MNTIERMNAVSGKLGLFRARNAYPTHAVLDMLDKAAHFNSRRHPGLCPCDFCRRVDEKANYVDARLARLERHVLTLRGKKTTRGWRTRARYFFWLGADAKSNR